MNKITSTQKYLIFIFLALIIIFIVPVILKQKIPLKEIFIKPRIESFLTFDDLTKLSITSRPYGPIYTKLQKQLTKVYIFNRYGFLLNSRFGKPYLRLAQWNIARGINVDPVKNVLSSPSKYYFSYKNNDRQNSLKKEASDFSKSDIILLNEVDIGLPWTKYRNIVTEIADSLGYNFAFATEFVELGPVIYLKNSIDKNKYLGLHGNAIISRFPIKNARIIRLPKCYDWYLGEINKKSPLETARRYGARAIFEQSIISEVRHGSRCALVADIELPNKEIVTVVSANLEDRCFPPCRLNQMEYLLGNIRHIRNPVVIGGDFNTTTTDSAPTSFKKEFSKRIKDPHFIARQALLALVPLGIPIPGLGNLAALTVSKTFQYKDPATPSIPVLFPNQERKFFNYIKGFQFADGETFDIRGNKSSNGKRGLFANSNERQIKGFESTFKLEEPRGIGYFKLDWFFVKPKRGRFTPFNGQTLQVINNSYPGRISDHEPIIVDLKL